MTSDQRLQEADCRAEPVRVPVEPPKRLLICERCWTVIGIDGENNAKRGPKLCSHLGPFIHAVTT